MVMMVMAMGQRSHVRHNTRAVETWLSICLGGIYATRAKCSNPPRLGPGGGYERGAPALTNHLFPVVRRLPGSRLARQSIGGLPALHSLPAALGSHCQCSTGSHSDDCGLASQIESSIGSPNKLNRCIN